MSSADHYLKEDLTIELLDHLSVFERYLLAAESGTQQLPSEALAESIRVFQDAAESAESLGFRNIQNLLREMTDRVLDLQQAHGHGQISRIGCLISAIDTLAMLLENVDRSDEFDIRGQLCTLQDCDGQDVADCLNPGQLHHVETTGDPASAHGSLRRFDQLTTARGKHASTRRPHPESPAEEVAVSVAPLTLQDSVDELFASYHGILQQLESLADRLRPNSQSANRPIEVIKLSDMLLECLPPFVGRIAGEQGKRCSVVISGLPVELRRDTAKSVRQVVEMLATMAVTERIETPEKRTLAGKPGVGLIAVTVFRSGGTLRLRIADDGLAIDVDALKSRAVGRKLISSEFAAEMSNRESLQLSLLPLLIDERSLEAKARSGCSLMADVRSTVETLGGRIDVDFRDPCGTEIEVTLPLAVPSVTPVASGAH